MKTASTITPREEYLCIRFMTTQQVCDELGIDRQSLKRWRDAGMPYVPVGSRLVRYNLNDVLGWLQDRKTASRAS